MKFVFKYTTATGREDTASFHAETEAEARAIAEDWATDGITIGECAERWSVES